MRLRSASVVIFSRSISPNRMSSRSNSGTRFPIAAIRPLTFSPVVRLSSEQSSTNRTSDSRSSWCAGIPSTTRGAAVGVSRTVPEWHNAQLNPT